MNGGELRLTTKLETEIWVTALFSYFISKIVFVTDKNIGKR